MITLEIIEGFVGKKGEIYVKKKLREALGLSPGDKVEFIIKGNIAIMRKKPSARDLLKAKKVKIDVKELLNLRKEFEEELIK